MAGSQNHPFGHTKTHLARSQVSYQNRQLADQVVGLVSRLDAREHLAQTTFASIQAQAQQLVRPFYGFTADDLGNAQINLDEVLDVDGVGNRFATGQDDWGWRGASSSSTMALSTRCIRCLNGAM